MAWGEGDSAGRTTGMVVFILGVLLLLAVFYLAYLELIAPGSGGALPGHPSGAALFVAAKGLFLFILGFAASSVANKGIALYLAAGRGREEEE